MYIVRLITANHIFPANSATVTFRGGETRYTTSVPFRSFELPCSYTLRYVANKHMGMLLSRGSRVTTPPSSAAVDLQAFLTHTLVDMLSGIFKFALSVCALTLPVTNVLGSPVDVSAAVAVSVESRATGIDQTTYDNLVRYTKYSSAVYQWICPAPLGNTLVDQFDISGTQGFVVRDDSRKEIVVALRGTMELKDAFIDAQIIQVPLKSTGLANVGDSYVHIGFLYAYNVVASSVLRTVKAQKAAYPSYTIIVTGHSLGAAVAALAAVSIKSALPSSNLKLYTFGQPRTGNAAFATYVENLIGINNIFRAVHTYDGVPTILFKALGYRHFANEYWNFAEPASAANTKKCSGGDDPSCSDSIPSTFINPAH
ncbi:hypothetical protein D9619_011731 [Psilocybe cf. subviscida]|uniref:Fungal lipase-type domain-containing protein n=1 Tax=Psilocybe cf. subviscida TaxID=2480587 RepID=A0A8H5BUG0_9AGAR|nr:hypothetical protein D9619_011731 [Psilocybe cf. subviscida]